MAIDSSYRFYIRDGKLEIYVSRSWEDKIVMVHIGQQLQLFFTAMTLGAILAILGLLFLDEFVNMLGATPTIAPYAKDYAKYILIATPYMCCAFCS